MKLEELQPQAVISGLLPNALVTVVGVEPSGDSVEVTYRTATGHVEQVVLYRDDEARLEIAQRGRPWSFDGDGKNFRLVSEAHRIRLAHLFDPLLAVHTSQVEPLPHQIIAVYEEMLPRQPLRFLLADDPGAGKTIMAGLLIKELIARGDLKRCLIVCPGALAEQWQDELDRRFQLPFDIMTNDKLEAARTGNWFAENDLVIARLDKLARNEDVQAKLLAPDCGWDLIVCDEAHKLSASFFGAEVTYTKRYRLAQLLSGITRHFLLMTATPHNGKEADFQLFMALLDGDRFEGKFRDGVHTVDVSDMMRRMVKENLLKFDGSHLFPERIAYTVNYALSDAEAYLYSEVTNYVRDEFNRADTLQGNKRATVGFALTILQRRLASSPEAIYQSLRRRRERLENRMQELEIQQRGAAVAVSRQDMASLDDEEVDDLEDAPETELEQAEGRILDQATAAGTLQELRAEIATLARLEALADEVRSSDTDRKWHELSRLLQEEIFAGSPAVNELGEGRAPYRAGDIPRPQPSPTQKLVIFTEHRDTLNYLKPRITRVLGREESVVVIHGGMGREERAKAQEQFLQHQDVQVLLATDAAGEGINLQRAHLMINYDLPWNPNRLEQRFGRIHRIGQTEVCHLWNLVARETREGYVYDVLLRKLEEARRSLGGGVFDVLGRLEFDGSSLKDLLIEAIRYGDRPEVRARLTERVEGAIDREHLQNLLEDRALVHDSMDVSGVQRIRADMERAETRRLQPHFIESFFIEAFTQLGGAMVQREPHRYQVSRVPVAVRERDRLIGRREPVLSKYERVAFDKANLAGPPLAAFISPGHPLLDATLDLTLERHRDLLRRGAVLVDERDAGESPRVLFYIEHAVTDAGRGAGDERRDISRRMLYVEIDAANTANRMGYAPYLDYRPLAEGEPDVETLLRLPEFGWIDADIEKVARHYANATLTKEHLDEVKGRRLEWIEKTRAAVRDRLTKEIGYWDHRAQQLSYEEAAGKLNAKLNAQEAAKRAEDLRGRLHHRTEQLDREAQISASPPIVLGGVVVVPAGLLARLVGRPKQPTSAIDTQLSAARARAIIMDTERSLGFEPVDRELEKLGYDIESRVPATGKLRFIEVKGRVSGAETVTVTKNEIMYSLNAPEDYILALVEFLGPEAHRIHYVRRPYRKEPEFHTTSINTNFSDLIAMGTAPS